MSIVRQDAWTNDEDLVLAEVVLRYIRDGGTQLAAFEEVGERLSRTSAACGFRWNSAIRKKYESAISIAKKQRKKLKKEKITEEEEEISVEGHVETERQEPEIVSQHLNVSLDDVISFLQELKQDQDNHRLLKKENGKLKQKIETLQAENTMLSEKLNDLETRYATVNQDYKSLIGIIDRAREMTYTNGET